MRWILMKSFLYKILREETVFCISLLFALLSMLAVKPDAEYAGYIDLRTLCLLFCLMAVTAGFQKCGIFRILAENSWVPRTICAGLHSPWYYCRFSVPWAITNDVALLTLFPSPSWYCILSNRTGILRRSLCCRP